MSHLTSAVDVAQDTDSDEDPRQNSSEFVLSCVVKPFGKKTFFGFHHETPLRSFQTRGLILLLWRRRVPVCSALCSGSSFLYWGTVEPTVCLSNVFRLAVEISPMVFLFSAAVTAEPAACRNSNLFHQAD